MNYWERLELAWWYTSQRLKPPQNARVAWHHERIKMLDTPQTEREYFAQFSGEDTWPGGLTSAEALAEMKRELQDYGFRALYEGDFVIR